VVPKENKKKKKKGDIPKVVELVDKANVLGMVTNEYRQGIILVYNGR
jgi:hypothetical protein